MRKIKANDLDRTNEFALLSRLNPLMSSGTPPPHINIEEFDISPRAFVGINRFSEYTTIINLIMWRVLLGIRTKLVYIIQVNIVCECAC
jgi:hypothetical protein